MRNLTHLRDILQYVPQYRDKTFVISLDGAVLAEPNFRNLLLDIALLQSLRIRVVLVHGAGLQIKRLAEETGMQPSNLDGTGKTDAATLKLALTAANRLTHDVLAGFASVDLRAAHGNAVTAHPAGILKGEDQGFTGRVDRIDVDMLNAMMQTDIVPVVPPLGSDGEGHTYRLNSDAVATEIAKSLKAVKLIFLACVPGVQINAGDTRIIRQLSVEEAEQLVQEHRGELPSGTFSKVTHAVRAAHHGVPRIHIIDGRVEEGLLAEVFSPEGIGTLVYANEYQAIRRATIADATAIWEIIHPSIKNDELLPRTKSEIEKQIDDFFVFEVEGRPVGCVALHLFPESRQAELACLCVNATFEHRGIGRRLIEFTERRGKEAGAQTLFSLSTQAINYFVKKGGFRHATPDELPENRRNEYDRNQRRSQVLLKHL